MLGNFSFGDYFKRDAIALRLGVRHRPACLGIAPDRLRVTVHHSDDEARTLWREIAGLPDHRIYGLGDKDNFWQMGDTGPCGPCTEIYVDLGLARRPGGARGGWRLPQAEFERLAEEGRLLEIWNLVFMQYDRSADGTLTPLPDRRSIPGRGWSESRRSCRAKTTTSIPICFARCSTASGSWWVPRSYDPDAARLAGVVPGSRRPCAGSELPPRRWRLSE